jgi:uncharacterized protein (DUF3084 family)
VFIPMTFFLTVGGVLIARGEIGKAIAHRIRGGGVSDEAVRGELAEMRQELDEVRHELAEVHERMEFAERLLARASSQQSLPGERG